LKRNERRKPPEGRDAGRQVTSDVMAMTTSCRRQGGSGRYGDRSDPEGARDGGRLEVAARVPWNWPRAVREEGSWAAGQEDAAGAHRSGCAAPRSGMRALRTA